MMPYYTRRALMLLLLQAHAAAFSGPTCGQRRSRVTSAAPGAPFACKRNFPSPPRLHVSRRALCRTVTSGGGEPRSTRTTLGGWFDGWGPGNRPRASSDKKGKGGDPASGKTGKPASKPSSKRNASGGGGAGTGDEKATNVFTRLGVGANGGGGEKGAATDARSKSTRGKEESADSGTLETLEAVKESFAAGAAAFQERFAQTSPHNVTLMWGGGALSNVTIPWKGIGVYAGGLVSGLAVAVGLLTVPYVDLGSPGLRKSLTLFENVLVDIDQGYVEEVNPERLLETAVVSMLRTLDPYTEYQNNQAAADLKETVSGRYGGVGLVISGGKQRAVDQQQSKGDADAPGEAEPRGGSSKKSKGKFPRRGEGSRQITRDGITVVSAFEGYAFDAGMRAGDRITAINGQPVVGISVDKARDLLRGEPNSKVSISFIRDGRSQQEQEITLTRRLVKLRDVKLATLVGDVKKAPIGYLELSGFSTGAGKELQQAYRYLDSLTENGLKGVILDLRGNPGGLLEAAVDVSALFVPKGSSIVSIKGRNFQDITYGSSQGPVRPAATPLVVLTNGGTASAAEIVSGAVQDLDAGVIVGVGNGRTYGKGLVQNVAELPYNNALKYTVAKYYTPSGRCIQSVNYKEGGVAMGDQPAIPGAGGTGYGYEASEVPEVERREFITKHGRVVFDGGGVEADVKVKLPKPSALEIALQVQGAYFDFAGQWTRTHTFKGASDVVTDGVLRDFKNFVYRRQKEGTYNLAGIYGPQLESLESILEDTNLNRFDRLVAPLPERLTQEMLTAFQSSKEQIRSQLEEAILSRYLPESMVLRRQLDKDPQFQVALELVQDKDMYNRIITPADAKLTEEVLRSFGQALKDSVQRGEVRLDLSSDEKGVLTVTPGSYGTARPRSRPAAAAAAAAAATAAGVSSGKSGGIDVGTQEGSLLQRVPAAAPSSGRPSP